MKEFLFVVLEIPIQLLITSLIMKYLILTISILTSCTNVKNEEQTRTYNNDKVVQKDNFKTVKSTKATYTLNYKIEEEYNSPVKRYTYYVTKTATNKVVRSSETVAAEKIYWKEDDVLAIIPYVEVMQQSTDVEAPQKQKEILIYINR